MIPTLFTLVALSTLPLPAANDHPHLLQKPALSQSQIVFSYAGDLWIVPRAGGTAQRLTSGLGVESEPAFSPDGKTIAFTGAYDGNVDVFTVPTEGGTPKRITHHPESDQAIGWTPDGKNIIFRSTRETYSRFTRLFTVPAEGGLPKPLPLPMGYSGAFSPDGKRFAYAPIGVGGSFTNFIAWKRYRGGRASFLWVIDMHTLERQAIPRTNSADFDPMWIGDKVYFLSDRDGSVSLFGFDPSTKAVNNLIKNSGYDIDSAKAGPGGIVYDQFGDIYLYDIAKGKAAKVNIAITGDMPEIRPHFSDVSQEIRAARISPTGVRALFEAHGEILTVPAAKGDFRDITNTPGVMERTPSWSPDGQSIAYFSDESGEYALHIKPQNGSGDPKKLFISNDSSYYVNPRWSPDSKFVAFHDNRLRFWLADIAAGKVTLIDTDEISTNPDISWSPDAKWLAFSKGLPNRLHAVNLYSLATAKCTQVTDGMSDARFPEFDKDGQYLYFTASTNYGTTVSGLDMSSDEFEVTRSVYALVLSNDAASPVAPESDEEKPGGAPKPTRTTVADAATVKPVRVDLTDMPRRIVALPIPARSYDSLVAGKAGTFYLTDSGTGFARAAGGGRSLQRFDLKTRKLEPIGANIGSFDLSADGEKMLISLAPARAAGAAPPTAPTRAPQYAIVSATAPIKTGDGLLRLAGMEVRVDPVAEWKQMYHEVWRIERSYFYDPHFHGVDISASEKKYEPYLDSLASRADLNYIFQEMLGEFTVGHMRGGGGNIPNPRAVPGGLLGADYEIADGRYRVKKIYSGESWNPQLRSPLVQPGIKVAPGDFILSINGQDLTDKDDISRLLEDTANKTVVLKLASDASGANAHEVSVVPVASELPLRNLAWIEENRRKVDRLSGGKLAYVYMPDTGQGGLTSFNRYFFAQTDRKGVIMDERFNAGGQVADYVIEVLHRPLLSYWAPRYGDIYKTPAGSIQGPKVMIVNEFAGSGGDAMPWLFRNQQLGTLVGKRTWGGLVGVGQYPVLMDGGNVTAPSFGFFSAKGEWDVENHGVAPDVEVELDPRLVAQGQDPQLERAVSIAMEQLQKNPPMDPKKPAYPNYHPVSKSATKEAIKGGTD